MINKIIKRMPKIIIFGIIFTLLMGVVSAYNVLLQCNVNPDCLIPPNCPGTTVSCVQNQCDYTTECTIHQVLNYLLVMRTSIPDEPTVAIIPEDYGFTYMGFGDIIAGKQFAVSHIDVMRSNPSCQVANGEWLDPSENPGCYRVNIQWGGYNFNVKNSETVTVSDNIKVSYILNSPGVFHGTKDTIFYNYEFVPSRQKENVFRIELEGVFEMFSAPIDTQVLLNRESEFCFGIRNNLFDISTGGYVVEALSGIRDIEYNSRQDVVLIPKGHSNQCIQFTPEELGSYEMKIIPFVDLIDFNSYFSNQRLNINFYASESDIEIGDVDLGSDGGGNGRGDNVAVPPSPPNNTLLIILGGFALLAFVLFMKR